MVSDDLFRIRYHRDYPCVGLFVSFLSRIPMPWKMSRVRLFLKGWFEDPLCCGVTFIRPFQAIMRSLFVISHPTFYSLVIGGPSFDLWIWSWAAAGGCKLKDRHQSQSFSWCSNLQPRMLVPPTAFFHAWWPFTSKALSLVCYHNCLTNRRKSEGPSGASEVFSAGQSIPSINMIISLQPIFHIEWYPLGGAAYIT